MAKGDDFQFRVRPAPVPAGQQRTDRRHERGGVPSAAESRENRDWRDCADQLDRSEIQRVLAQGELVRTCLWGAAYALRIRRRRNSPNT